jgi:hypothetical protein
MNERKKTSRERLLKKPLLCYFDEPQVVALKRLSESTGKPVQHFVRLGVDLALAKHKVKP